MKSYFLKFLTIFVFMISFVSAEDMFWEMNGTRGGKVYILGAIDAGNRDMYPLAVEIKEAFSRSHYLILPTRKSVGNDTFINNELYVEYRFEDNDSLDNHLSVANRERLQFWLEDLKLPAQSMNRFQPWVTALTLSEMDTSLWGQEDRLSLQSYFYQEARRNNKGVYGLERVADFLMRLKDDDDDFQNDLFETFVDLRATSQEERDERYKQYAEHNKSYLIQTLIKPFEKHPKVKRRILQDTVDTYVHKILLYRKNKKARHYFIIIDLRYLLGEKGVISQLQEAGVELSSE